MTLSGGQKRSLPDLVYSSSLLFPTFRMVEEGGERGGGIGLYDA
jgi:hypothetical protein